MSPAAAVLGAIFCAVLALTCADDLLAIRYVVPLYPLLCVFLGSTLVRFGAIVSVDSPAPWRPALAVAAVIALLAAVYGDVAFALKNAATPKSGIRTLALSRGFDPVTLYVVAPDYTAATFAFYSRRDLVALRGFVRYVHPEVFRLEGYVRDWNRPDAIAAALRTIQTDARQFRCLDLVVDASTRDQAKVPYGKTWRLLDALRAGYPAAGLTPYPGRYEAVQVYRFAVPKRSGADPDICR